MIWIIAPAMVRLHRPAPLTRFQLALKQLGWA
jgi:hypothetical protein